MLNIEKLEGRTFFMKLRKHFVVLAVLALFSLVVILQEEETKAGVYFEPYLSDNFDGPGLNAEKWQEVNDTSDNINFFEKAGTLRYDNIAGAEETIITSNPLTIGNDVTGYSVQFDFLYKTDDWGDWYGFAFDKTAVEKGLPWSQSGYLFGRNTSLQVQNANDVTSVDPNSDNIAAYAEMTPTLGSISNQNVTFKFVYTKATKELEMYYDLAGENADLTTLRNTFTFNDLTDQGEYHFAIVGSGKGLFEVDNMKIDIIKDQDTENYLDTDFETATLPEQLTLVSPDSFSFGPAKSLTLTNLEAGAKLLTANSFTVDENVNQSLDLSYDIQLTDLTDSGSVGFVYGLSDTTKVLTDEGVTYIYLKNKTVGEGEAAVTSTYVGAVQGDGTQVVQVLNETDLGVNLVGDEPFKMDIKFYAYNEAVVTIAEQDYSFIGGDASGYFGFTAEGTSSAMIDNFKSMVYKYDDQSNNKDLYNNFNTGYVNPEDWEIDNYRDLKPGTEIPMFPSAQGIYVDEGKLIFDVASESAGFFTKQSFSDFEMRFTLTDFDQPVTQPNEDGELDGIEVPATTYVAVSMGYTDIAQNPWNVASVIFQNRDNAAQLYSLNMNDSSVKILNPALQLNSDENDGATWEFKIIAQGGTVKVWMKRATDPQALFEGAPLHTFYNVDHFGRIAIASSIAGSFKIDDLSIVRTDDSLQRPVIEDEVDPASTTTTTEQTTTTTEETTTTTEATQVDDDSEENGISALTIVGIIIASLAVGGGVGFTLTKFKK